MADARVTSAPVLLGLALGITGLLVLIVVERRARHPMLPLKVFRSKTFTAANLVTFEAYAGLGGVFFLTVLDLQVVAGFEPLTAGTALLPVTVLMLLLPARSGALAEEIGPRIPITLGSIVCAGALLLLGRIGEGPRTCATCFRVSPSSASASR